MRYPAHTTNLSATPGRPACPSRASGWSSLATPRGFPFWAKNKDAAALLSASRPGRQGSAEHERGSMGVTKQNLIVNGLEAMKSGGVTRYNLTWDWLGGEPKIAVWRACDTSDESPPG